MNGTVGWFYTKITIMQFFKAEANPTVQNVNIEHAQDLVYSVAKEVAQTYGEYKVANNTFIIDIYKNKETLTLIFITALTLSISALLIQRSKNFKKISKETQQLPEKEKTLNNVTS
jgi:hypothetical protein